LTGEDTGAEEWEEGRTVIETLVLVPESHDGIVTSETGAQPMVAATSMRGVAPSSACVFLLRFSVTPPMSATL
jgi:hypothetical protein